MTILNVNYRQFEEYHFVFAQMNAALLHWWAKQKELKIYFNDVQRSERLKNDPRL